MGEEIHCNVCGKPAKVHLTKIIKNQIQKVDLCEDCAQAKGVTDVEGISLADLLIKSFPTEAAGEGEPTGLVCEQCGFTQRDFKRTGRLGCPKCYESLRPLILPLLAGLHKGQRHLGKAPSRRLQRAEWQRQLDTLEQEMANATKAENFEDAARCRDGIAELRAKLEVPALPA